MLRASAWRHGRVALGVGALVAVGAAFVALHRRARRAALLTRTLAAPPPDAALDESVAEGAAMPARMSRALYEQANAVADAAVEDAAKAAALAPAAAPSATLDPPPKKIGAPHLVSAPKKGRQPSVTLVAPHLQVSWDLELSLHSPSRLLRRDVELVFRPDLEAEYRRHPNGSAAGTPKDDFLQQCLVAVPTWQPSRFDLSEMSDPVNTERRGLLANFEAWADQLRPKLAPYWSDVSCPVEGTPTPATPTPRSPLPPPLPPYWSDLSCPVEDKSRVQVSCMAQLFPIWHTPLFPLYTSLPFIPYIHSLYITDDVVCMYGNTRERQVWHFDVCHLQ